MYQLSEEGASQEELEEEDLAAAQHWMLPAAEFHGLWDSLIFDSHIKAEVLLVVILLLGGIGSIVTTCMFATIGNHW